MSENIKTGDYTGFDDAVASVVKFTNSIVTENDNIRTNLNTISDDDVFAGPILDSAKDGLANLNDMIDQTKSSFDSVASNLEQVSSNYQAGDASAKDQILAVAQNGLSEYNKLNANRQKVMLVNPWNAVPDGYNPKLTKVEGYYVEEEAAKNLNTMLEKCREAGGSPQIISGYRSVDTQKDLYDKAGGSSQSNTAKPGYSEHHTGKAVDILEKGYGSDWDNAPKTAKTETQKWLTDNCADYGYVLRYPKGKESVTGIDYESWHYTYVGSSEVAHEIMDNDLTIEEYLNKNEYTDT